MKEGAFIAAYLIMMPLYPSIGSLCYLKTSEDILSGLILDMVSDDNQDLFSAIC